MGSTPILPVTTGTMLNFNGDGVGMCKQSFNITVNDFDADKVARYSQVLVVTELVVNGTLCTAW